MKTAVPKYRVFHDVWSRIDSLYAFIKYISDRMVYEDKPAETEEMIVQLTQMLTGEQLILVYEDMLLNETNYMIFSYVLDEQMQSDSSLLGIVKGIVSSAVLQNIANIKNEDDIEDDVEEMEGAEVKHTSYPRSASINSITEIINRVYDNRVDPIDEISNLTDEDVVGIFKNLSSRGIVTFDSGTANVMYESGVVGGIFGVVSSVIYAILIDEISETPETYSDMDVQ